MKNLKPYQEIYLVALWICVQIIVGTIIKRELIPDNWIAQFSLIIMILSGAQVFVLINYFFNKYYD